MERADRPLPHSFLLKSLSDFAGDLEGGSRLCPVRALRIYLDRTKSGAFKGSSLFVSPSCPTRPISKNVISYFLREVISGAVRSGLLKVHPCAHTVSDYVLFSFLLSELFCCEGV